MWVLCETLGLTGTKLGCGIAQCGNCTVHRDGEAAQSGGLVIGFCLPGTVSESLARSAMPFVPNAFIAVFEGRTPAALCRQLLDPEQNGNMDADDIVNHISKDPLVLWGWEPGDGRSLPPLSHAEFEALMVKWVEMGAACPEESPDSG